MVSDKGTGFTVLSWHTIFPCWVQAQVEEVVRLSGSNKVDLVSQTHRFLVLQIPLHKQLTLGRNALAGFKVVYILSIDL